MPGQRRNSGSVTTRGSSRSSAAAGPAGWPGPTVCLLAVLSAIIVSVMQDVTAILNAIEEGDPRAAAQLLPLVYDELRKLAAARMADKAPGNTLNATALVHEAYLRLVGRADEARWDNRGHFFAAAAEAMRRILVDAARRKRTEKHGGGRRRVDLPDVPALPEGRGRKTARPGCRPHPVCRRGSRRRRLVELRHFAGLSIEDAAAALGLSRAAAYRHWTYARAWLRDAISRADHKDVTSRDR